MGNSEITPLLRGNVLALEIRFGVLMGVSCRRSSRGLEWRDLALGPRNLLMMGNLSIKLGIEVPVSSRGVET
jgi:hypothetical protein